MGNFCINCGAKIRKEDNYCMNCGTKIRKDYTYCTNCGTKIREEDNYCIICGTKIYKSNIKENDYLLKSSPETIDGIEEKEKKIIMIDELFKSKEIEAELRKNKIDQNQLNSIKDNVKNKINSKENVIKGEILYLIKDELEKVKITKENEILKMIDELFESKEVKAEIRKNKIDDLQLISIKKSIKNNLIHKENKTKGEIKHIIKNELEKASKKPEKIRTGKEDEANTKQNENKIENEEIVSSEILSLIRKNKIQFLNLIYVDDEVKNKFINKRRDLSDDEIRYLIKQQRAKITKEKRISEMIDEVIESSEIKAEITKNKIDQNQLNSIKDNVKNKIYHKENVIKGEIIYLIKDELEKASKEKEEIKIVRGGYCSSSCLYYQEEFLDSSGGIVGDYVDGGYTEYYCSLGNSLGGFCKDYE